MRRWICCLVALTLLFLTGHPIGDAQARTKTKDRSSSARIMFELLDEIDQSPALSPAKTEELLKITLKPVAEESNEYFYVFKGQGGLWKEAELRLPRSGDGRRFVLVLEPVAPLPMKEVIAHFGDTFAMESPNPSAGDQAMVGYVYHRAAGTLRFSFPSFEDYGAKIVLFDRAG